MSDVAKTTKPEKANKPKKDSKRKRTGDPTTTTAGFSLLGASNDAGLEDIFGKSVSRKCTIAHGSLHLALAYPSYPSLLQ